MNKQIKESWLTKVKRGQNFTADPNRLNESIAMTKDNSMGSVASLSRALKLNASIMTLTPGIAP